MKRCPECRRDYSDDTLIYCLEDGAALVQGSVPSPQEPQTAILHSTDPLLEGATQASIETTEKTVALPAPAVLDESHSAGFDKRFLLAPLAVALIAFGVYLSYRAFYVTTSDSITSIAVLPFQNKSGDPNSEYLSDGLAESLIYRLSRLPGLKVSPTSSVVQYKDKDTKVADIASELGVDAVMTGRLSQIGDNLTISIELVDVRNNKVLWGEQYERKMSDLLATQREIATEITNRLKLKLSGDGEQKLTKSYTDNDQAYQLYLRGRFHFAKRTSEDMRKSIEYYQQAITLDPNFALAYVGIADTYNIMAASTEVYRDFLDVDMANSKGMAAALRALEIDPELAESHTALAHSLSIDWKWAEADREFKIAIDLDPQSASAHYAYGLHLTSTGETGMAIAEIERAVHLEPMSLIMNLNLAGAYMFDRQNARALELVKRTYELEPNYPSARRWLSYILVANGNYDEALALSENEREPWIIRFRGFAYAKTGRRAEAEAVIRELRSQDRDGLSSAMIYGALGENDKAFAELEKATVMGHSRLRRLKVDPLMDPLRSDPRFNEILRRMNLPE